MDAIALEARYSAANYHPLPVVLTRGQGAWLWDVDGRRYLDMMSAYSAVSHGHAHPRIIAALEAQARRLAVPSRAFYNDRLGPFLEKLCAVAGSRRGAADEHRRRGGRDGDQGGAALGLSRQGHRRRPRRDHRRRRQFPRPHHHHRRILFGSGLSRRVRAVHAGLPHRPVRRSRRDGAGDHAQTAAILVEPIQGEAGIIVPPAGWLAGLRRLCDRHNVLLILDEVQSGLGRTGAWFAFQHENVLPDGLVLGKALGGGVLPVSAFLGRRALMEMFTPGSHGSTFGGNASAAAVGLEALQVIEEEGLVERSRVLGAHMLERLAAMHSPVLKAVRGRGLWVGAEIDPAFADAREACELLLHNGRAVEGNPRHGSPAGAAAGHFPGGSRLGARSLRGHAARARKLARPGQGRARNGHSKTTLAS